MNSKQKIRKDIRAKRQRLSEFERQNFGLSVASQLKKFHRYQSSKNTAIYLASDGELPLNSVAVDIWKRKLDWIVEQGGMALVNVHPDYINFGQNQLKTGEFPVEFYTEFLQYIKMNFKGKYWQPLPQELARYYRDSLFNDSKDNPIVSVV